MRRLRRAVEEQMGGLRVAIVGSGFAGSILARILHRQGHEVALVDRGAHPRFALGESSTPLAAICLERLAARYSLADLHHLAAYGRWLRHMPEVRRGLKRGFTFYAHRPGRPFGNSDGNRHRLLVAASPVDAVADTHWLRSDVDHFLVCQAEQAGVPFFDETELQVPEWHAGGVRLAGRRRGTPWSFAADVVIDASGAGGFLARHLPIPSRPRRMRLRTGLIYSHFDGARPFAEAAAETGAELPPGPYPDERAAVHHLLPEGWLYVLPFDHGTVSAGFVLERSAAKRSLTAPPEPAWRELLARYPTLNAQFGDARPTRPIATIPRLQRRLAGAAGPNWALLPHAFAFLSPLFSTGIAWSLVAVERLALVLEGATAGRRRRGLAGGLAQYGRLLDTEANHLTRLVEGAYRARHDFDVFVAYSFLYFALASYAEAAQRLLPERPGGGPWGWSGFLGADDPVGGQMVRRATALLAAASRTRSRDRGTRFFDTMARLIAPRNVAGLADPGRRRLYPVDLDALVESAGLLGLSPDAITQALPRLRGFGETA
ncbi:MAG: tryptophan 7-halogenase [Gemmatimonadetes bacterium]|nr:tryptophan 7-halogenase [Gemmatimonadota bacterium]